MAITDLPIPERTALVVVDVQHDFCEGGSLPVTGGAAVAARTAELVRARHDEYAGVVFTRDWHTDPGDHWAAQGTDPDYAATWPVHCQAGTHGARFHSALGDVVERFGTVVSKGADRAAYSGFEGTDDATGLGLEALLRAGGAATRLDVCGIATDHCVRATVLDALAAGFPVRVLIDLCAGVAPATTDAALAELVRAGADVVHVGAG